MRETPSVWRILFIYHSLVLVSYSLKDFVNPSPLIRMYNEEGEYYVALKGKNIYSEKPAGSSQPLIHRFPMVLAIGNE